jgi:DNA mismatch repair protein MutS
MAELTPMMKQYLEIKERNPDCILFFRLGDFYEMFNEDARLASRELDLTLTTRDRGKAEEDRTPMCGVPFHSSESYIARLVAKGYKVAICEQMEDPALAKGLVKRDIIRVVTPGTVTESSMLDESRNNYFACVFCEADQWGLCLCDVSTGVFYATQATGNEGVDKIINELGRFAPAEVLLGGEAASHPGLLAVLDDRLRCCHEVGEPTLFDPAATLATVCHQFGEEQVSRLGLEASPHVLRAAGALISTLVEAQKTDLNHIREISYYVSGKFMELDLNARRNLELTETLRSKEKRGSLLWVLDKTKTAMGGRLLRSWLEKPLLSPAAIGKRLSAVEELVNDTVAREELRRLLRDVSDLERIMARIVTGTANARDLVALANGTAVLPQLRAQLEGFQSKLLQELVTALDPLEDLYRLICSAIVDDPPFTVREGGMIRAGFHEEIDRLRDIQQGGKGSIAAIEAREKEKTGIKGLKVGYNRVFGYYIEVSKSYADQVPEGYIRKQTLANNERYITQELKELEDTILNAKDRITALEYEQFTAIRQHIADQSARVQLTAQAVAAADVLCAFAAVAVQQGYCKPEIDLSGDIAITEGRHPVVEQVLSGSLFVPNDTVLRQEGDRVSIITGPNMAGKSTYMRQVALIVIMAQIGSYVPARSARIGIVDRVFTRIGASDDLTSGQSTFMVEMNEVSEILKHATPRSLLILDEIGRGTSTFDGMAIARAVLEYAADKKRLGAKTLFATHYHELTVLADELQGVKNYNIAVKKRGDDVVFLRRIVPGAADESFGIEVAKLAGLPDRVVSRARTFLKELESGNGPAKPAKTAPQPQDDQVSLLDMGAAQVRQRLESISVETLTPIEAMNVLYELKQMLQ